MSRLLIVLTVVLVAAVMIVSWVLGPGMEQRLVPGVWVWNASLGGMELSDAQSHLEMSLPLHQPNVVLVGPEGQRWALSPAELGMAVDAPATLSQAYAVGHMTKGSRMFSERLEIMLDGVMLPPVLAWNGQQTWAFADDC